MWETVNTYFINNKYTQNSKPSGISEYWEEFWTLLEKYPISQHIQNSIQSKNPLVRMFAILDRRIGKRTISKMQNVIDEQPEWLRKFYELRIDAETSNIE